MCIPIASVGSLWDNFSPFLMWVHNWTKLRDPDSIELEGWRGKESLANADFSGLWVPLKMAGNKILPSLMEIMFTFNFVPVLLLHNSPGFSGAPAAGNLACFTLYCVASNFLLYVSEQMEQDIRNSGLCRIYSQQHGWGYVHIQAQLSNCIFSVCKISLHYLRQDLERSKVE